MVVPDLLKLPDAGRTILVPRGRVGVPELLTMLAAWGPCL